ncbi:MAG: sugar O-acetyltransferase [Chitinophagaceae bacterium]|nr:MAG: sugar O-acetyltransferase [Chitinophagaceae bacterium]
MLTEKEKMLEGLPYQANDPVLVRDRNLAKTMVFEFNSLHPDRSEDGKALLRKLFGATKNNFHIEQSIRIDYGYNIYLGENFYANYNLVILDCAAVTIGDNVMLAPNVGIYTAGHPIHHEPRNAGFEYAFPINIGNNVWVGANVIINPGVSIGDNTVIGSGSVVTRSIPANVVAVGNPCRVIKEITEGDRDFYFGKMKFPV